MLSVLKKTAKYLLARRDLRTDQFWQDALSEKTMVALGYHRVGDLAYDPFELSVGLDAFEQQMLMLTNHPFLQPVSIDAYEAILLGLDHYPDRIPVLVSFDDGYRDNVEAAAPILAKHGIPAIMYVASGVLENGALWYDVIADSFSGSLQKELGEKLGLRGLYSDSVSGCVEAVNSLPENEMVEVIHEIQAFGCQTQTKQKYVDLEDLRQWLAMGFDIGAHTVTHPRLTGLSVSAARFEILNSIAQLTSATGRSITSIAYPFGTEMDFSDALIAGLGDCSVRSAFTTVPGRNTPGRNMLQQKRKCISNRQFRRIGTDFCETLFFADVLAWATEKSIVRSDSRMALRTPME